MWRQACPGPSSPRRRRSAPDRHDHDGLLQGQQQPRPAETAANAPYNIAPDIGGFYFNKIACFCFSEQHLGPNETAELPVVFFLDPALEQDPSMKAVDTLTLSYTFFAAKPQPAVAAAASQRTAPSAPKL